MIDLAFWILAIVMIASAVAVVILRDVFRAALLLILCFFTVAGIYITLNADFLGVVQVLVYVGAIGILLMFAIMLTRDIHQGSPFNRINGPALLVALMILATVVSVVVTTEWPTFEITDLPTVEVTDGTAVEELPQAIAIDFDSPSTEGIAKALFDKDRGFVFPFEVASVLLLAALIGAVVLVMSKKRE
jgi:NADH:ubiquinone oxidoreductase subunit 6 (subunit J)